MNAILTRIKGIITHINNLFRQDQPEVSRIITGNWFPAAGSLPGYSVKRSKTFVNENKKYRERFSVKVSKKIKSFTAKEVHKLSTNRYKLDISPRKDDGAMVSTVKKAIQPGIPAIHSLLIAAATITW